MNRQLTVCLLCVVAFFSAVCAVGTEAVLSISSPADGSDVPEIINVSGTINVSAPASVYVVVHPVNTGDYWVQQQGSVSNNGTWRVNSVHFGQGQIGVGEVYEIRAFINPESPLRSGQVLKEWPAAQAQSGTVAVTRR